MPTHRRIALAVLMCALAACSDPEQARQLRQAQDALRAQQGVEAARIALAERQAGIAAGCDWGISVCPPHVTAPGHAAQGAGYGGGASAWFWLAIIAKLAALGAALGAAYGAGRWTVATWAAPAEAEAEAAKKAISEAENRTAKAELAAQAAEDRAKKAEAYVKSAKQAALLATKQRAEAEAALANAKAAQDALSAFQAPPRKP